MAFSPSGFAATKKATTRQADPCESLEAAYQQCFYSLTSTDVDACIDCVNGKMPPVDSEGYALCTDILDWRCNAPTSCTACGQCTDEMTAWGMCQYDNSGCPASECPAQSTETPPTPAQETNPPGGGGFGECPGGSMNACLAACLSSCS